MNCRMLALVLILFAATAAGKPLTISFSPASQSVVEGTAARLTLNRAGGNGRLTAARVTASDGSYSGLIMPGATFELPTIDDTAVHGSRDVIVTATSSTGAKASARITVLDNDIAPIPIPLPPSPSPTPSGQWVSAPLVVGGYAWPKSQGPCCNGLIFRIVGGGGLTADADPTKQQHWWAVQYYSDTSGSYPANNPYWSAFVGMHYDESLTGIAPAP